MRFNTSNQYFGHKSIKNRKSLVKPHVEINKHGEK